MCVVQFTTKCLIFFLLKNCNESFPRANDFIYKFYYVTSSKKLHMMINSDICGAIHIQVYSSGREVIVSMSVCGRKVIVSMSVSISPLLKENR